MEVWLLNHNKNSELEGISDPSSITKKPIDKQNKTKQTNKTKPKQKDWKTSQAKSLT